MQRAFLLNLKRLLTGNNLLGQREKKVEKGLTSGLGKTKNYY